MWVDVWFQLCRVLVIQSSSKVSYWSSKVKDIGNFDQIMLNNINTQVERKFRHSEIPILERYLHAHKKDYHWIFYNLHTYDYFTCMLSGMLFIVYFQEVNTIL